MRSLRAFLFGISIACVLGVGSGCGLTGGGTRQVNSGTPPSMSGQAATTGGAGPTWKDPCGPATMMALQTLKGWEPALGPCYDRRGGLDANGREYPPVARPGLEYVPGKNNPQLVLRFSAAQNGMASPGSYTPVAAADYQGTMCFAAFPAGMYRPDTLPTASVMECANSIEFPKRWLRTLACNGGTSCDFDLFVVCANAPCKLGAVGIMQRPSDGPG